MEADGSPCDCLTVQLCKFGGNDWVDKSWNLKADRANLEGYVNKELSIPSLLCEHDLFGVCWPVPTPLKRLSAKR